MAMIDNCKAEGSEGEGESLDDLFSEIWERESQLELRFDVAGVGTVMQTQDLHGHRWEVNNFSNTVWEAAIWMHHFFQDERCFPVGWLRGRRVLELGAGTGLVGLTLALLGAEVIMTDLPEALPILRHNTEATFGSSGGDCSQGPDDIAAQGSCRRTPLLAGGNAKRPMIRQLRWGDSREAGEVAAAAAAGAAGAGAAAGAAGAGAAAAAAGAGAAAAGGLEWQGFDLIVGADVIYNEPTFPALVSTLSDRRLCSESTIVYLATMLRGGRHEGLLEQLKESFHVRGLDPTCADDLRARVSEGRAWVSPEWQSGKLQHQQQQEQQQHQQQQQQRRRKESGYSADTAVKNRDRGKDAAEGGGKPSCRSQAGLKAFTITSGSPLATAAVGMLGEARVNGGLASEINADGGRGGQGSEWSYEERGLGKILAFAARSRRGGEPNRRY